MKAIYRKMLTTLFSGLLLSNSAFLFAGNPVWTFTPLTTVSLSVPSNSTGIVQYLVTNQSKKSHSLMMTPISGITQITQGEGVCGNPFTLPSQGSSCTLSLEIYGNQLMHSINSGPIVCEQGSTLQCYQPSPSNMLNINLGISEYTVGGDVSNLTGTLILQNNGTDIETVSSDGTFTFPTPVTEGKPYNVTVLTQPQGQTCSIANGLGRIEDANVTNISINCVPNGTTLSISVSTLALSVNNTSLNPALTGTPRQITITNIGSIPANDVTYTPSFQLPIGTTITPASCGNLAVSDTCVLNITPGSAASATPGNTNPSPITLNISGANTNTLTPTISIITYGSVYQSGYVYAIDDTTPNTGSIGGKVAALNDQAPIYPNGIIWGSNGSNAVSQIAILGINETSTISSPSPTSPAYPAGTPAYTPCNGKTDGFCDSSNIVSYYNFNRASGGAAPTPLTQYAAGLCKATINGYSDWYLPAICEEGYDGFAQNSGCGTSVSPLLQNMQSNLVNNGNIGGLSGTHWSSTEQSFSPSERAWMQFFATSGSGNSNDAKYAPYAVRCSRALTF